MKTILLLQVLSTLMMAGAIWIVQVVHYPLFAWVGEAGWAAYEALHQSRITWVVGPLMVLELVTAVWLVLDRPEVLPLWLVVTGALLVGIIWASTAFVQVPLHGALSQGVPDPEAIHRLVVTNWIRTAAWTVRAGLVLWMLWLAIPSSSVPS